MGDSPWLAVGSAICERRVKCVAWIIVGVRTMSEAPADTPPQADHGRSAPADTEMSNIEAPARFSGFALKPKRKEVIEGVVQVVEEVEEDTEMIDAIDHDGVNSLNKKKEAEAALIAEAEGLEEKKELSTLELPMLLANRPEGWDDLTDETEKYKADMAWRPDEPTLADYERVKVEDIGAGMLRGMGWAPGKPVGKEGAFARIVEPVEFLKRPSGLGLGASMTAPEPKKKKKHIKMGESRDKKQEFYVTESGRSKRFLDEKLVKRRSTTLEE